jgi:hypothetical protein
VCHVGHEPVEQSEVAPAMRIMAARAERVNMYDHEETFENTFDEHVLPEYLRQAPWAEFVE